MSRSAADARALAVLRARADDAIVDLAAIRSRDPASERAMQVVRLTLHTLEAFWVPALDATLERRRDPGPGTGRG